MAVCLRVASDEGLKDYIAGLCCIKSACDTSQLRRVTVKKVSFTFDCYLDTGTAFCIFATMYIAYRISHFVNLIYKHVFFSVRCCRLTANLL